MASAKLAKITVRKSQTVMDQVKIDGWAIASTKVTTVPTSTTNMTGLRICTAGFSLRNESTRAWRRIGPSKRLRASATPWGDAGRRRLVRLGGGHGHEKHFP